MAHISPATIASVASRMQSTRNITINLFRAFKADRSGRVMGFMMMMEHDDRTVEKT
ncbi:MAG: hypothetical protein QNJ53_23850 [Pleurocapsa sp. MO_192.B19]|nr:hypothetical protein [Pleurocapsa sp. MO_192.B19]